MCLIGLVAFNMTFGRHPFEENKEYKPDFFTETLMAPKFQELITCTTIFKQKLKEYSYNTMTVKSNEGLTLVGYFFENTLPSENTVILIHGYQSNGFNDHSTIATKYLEHGYNVLLLDNRACGRSDGKYVTFGVKEAEDTLLWCKEIASKYPNGKIVVQGTSLGAATTCILSSLDVPKQVKCFVSDCSYTNMKYEFKHMVTGLFHIPTWPVLNVMEGWAKIKGKFDFTSISPINSVKNAKRPILFLHGKDDQFIPCNCSQELFDACTTEKEIVFFDGYGHAESHLDFDNYFSKVFSFVDKY